MSLKRVWALIKTEVFHGPKDVVFVMAVVMPVLLALFVNLAFGEIFTDRAKLGIYDEGNSPIVSRLQSVESIDIEIYYVEADLRAATASGALDMGVVLPADFDNGLATGTVRLKAYVWGESLARNRSVIPIAIADAVRGMTGSELPVNIETVALGDESSLPWSDRFLPLIVIMAVFLGGMMLPASSLIHEKQRRTLEALNVTPATIGDIFIAKGIIGAVLAIVMGVLTLAISTSFGSSPLALVLVLALGAIMAVEIGLILGAYIGDINTLFAFWKFGGLLLFGPAIVFMFPQIPSWVGYIFPTFYVIRPVTDMTVMGLGFGQVALYVWILVAIVAVMGLAVTSVVRRLSTQALRLNS
ncbi:MAG: ABC transporter permease [Dehalococcoidia bacterium]|nr:MAG: ABC transporter permease [Dehalococcoidia bacterium]